MNRKRKKPEYPCVCEVCGQPFQGKQSASTCCYGEDCQREHRRRKAAKFNEDIKANGPKIKVYVRGKNYGTGKLGRVGHGDK